MSLERYSTIELKRMLEDYQYSIQLYGNEMGELSRARKYRKMGEIRAELEKRSD